MVVLIRCNGIITDPRAMKYVTYLKETGQDYILIGWDRDGGIQDSERAFYYHHKAGYNVGGVKAVINRVGWMAFVVKTLKSLHLKGFAIHACDLDAVYPAVIYNKIVSRSRKARILFDVFDWFSATLFEQPKPVLCAFKHMEHVSVNNSNLIVICEPERIEQIPYRISKEKISVFPNIPYFSETSFLVKKKEFGFDNDLFTFSYVGGFVQSRCINEIITLAEHGMVNLLIAGFGDTQIEERLTSLKNHLHIKYFGRVKYMDGLNIMYNSDVIYAMYSKVNPNHIYAAPNKYYESMFLGKPIFSTKGTIVEKKVISNKTGYVSEESVSDIKNVISSITRDSIIEYGENAHRLWIEKYGSYTSDWLNNEYRAFINDCN